MRPRPTASCLIVSTPGAGAGRFAGVLRRTGLVGRPAPYFGAEERFTWARRWGVPTRGATMPFEAALVGAALVRTTGPNAVFSASFTWLGLTSLLRALEPPAFPEPHEPTPAMVARWFPRPRYVHLVAGDPARQAVRHVLATQGPAVPAVPGPALLARIRWTESAVVRHDRSWRSFLGDGDAPVLSLPAEEVGRRPAEAVAAVLAHMGVAGTPDVRPVPRRPSPREDRWLEAYLAVRDRLPEVVATAAGAAGASGKAPASSR